MKFQLSCIAVTWMSIIFTSVYSRIHKFETQKDKRRYFALSTFGFYKGGILDVNLMNFKVDPFNESDVYGFSVDRTLSDAMHPYLDNHQDRCLLQDTSYSKSDLDQRDETAIIYFIMDLKNLTNSLRGGFSDTALFPREKRKISSRELDNTVCSQLKLPLTMKYVNNERFFNASFAMYVASEEEEGLYNLYFHNCPNYKYDTQVALDFTIQIAEINNGNFLSAGEMPLPALYFMTTLLFFLLGSFWLFILKKSKHPVFKIHYVMAILVYLKSLSLLFHGINYHFIETKGEHVAAWAILYYIAHLLKGAVFLITILLVGTGWTFIKHILTDNDKRLFMIVIPLQVLANIAEIVIEESEKGDVEYKTWRDVFIMVDLFCCGAILFPVVWSIRLLKKASHADEKPIINLRKLKIFKHFYIMIVCYIYFTRIIVCLLKIIVPFQYEWLDEMFREMATIVFFVLTGYKFQPASANPYFAVTTDEFNHDDDKIDVVVTGNSGIIEGLSKVNKVLSSTVISEVPSSRKEVDTLINKRESSYEYD